MRRLDILVLFMVALVARVAAAALVDYPPYTDPAYYSLVAQQIAGGHGFNVPVLWSFLEVGGHLPAVPTLPVPSNGHWMPLTSIVASGAVALLGPVIGAWRAAEIPTILLGSALVPFTYVVTWELWRSRSTALAASLLVLLAGPLLVMVPLVDNFAVFGAAGAAAIWFATRAVGSARPGPWLGAAGFAAGIATLARIDGLLLAVAPAAAWLVHRDWSSWPVRLGWGIASATAFLLAVVPWLIRDLAVFGSILPSAGGHTLWITSYNQQFSIANDPSLGDYLGWGAANVIGSKLAAWVELVGRTAVLLGGIFVIPFAVGLWRERRRPELAPFIAYFVVMFVAMGAVFTFHAPNGAFYHSALAWLPVAAGMAVANLGPVTSAGGRAWPFLRRTATHRFLLVAGLAGAAALSLIGSSVLIGQWSDAHVKLALAGKFLTEQGARHDRVIAYDPAALWAISGNPGVAPPYDLFPVVGEVIDAYDVRWVVVTLPLGQDRDPLDLWVGAAGTDSAGNHADFLPQQPAFSAPGVRVYEVEASAR
jgi:4-amino-4-deoxy-L-arabinose transferase-like glycosyltransferase